MQETLSYKTITVPCRGSFSAIGKALQLRMDFLRERMVADPTFPLWEREFRDVLAAVAAYNKAVAA